VGVSPRVLESPRTLRIEKVTADPKETIPLFSHVLDM